MNSQGPPINTNLQDQLGITNVQMQAWLNYRSQQSMQNMQVPPCLQQQPLNPTTQSNENAMQMPMPPFSLHQQLMNLLPNNGNIQHQQKQIFNRQHFPPSWEQIQHATHAHAEPFNNGPPANHPQSLNQNALNNGTGQPPFNQAYLHDHHAHQLINDNDHKSSNHAQLMRNAVEQQHFDQQQKICKELKLEEQAFEALKLNDRDSKEENENSKISSEESRQLNSHVFFNGALYNSELLDMGARPMINENNERVDSDDSDAYDPLDVTLPTIYGIRFYNPNYGPEGAVPKRTKVPKPKRNRHLINNTMQFGGPPKPCEPSMLRYNHPMRPFNYINNRETCGMQNGSDAIQNDLKNNANVKNEKKLTSNSENQNSNNPKVKQSRRHARNRSRGVTQSFGIVAPGRRNSDEVNDENIKTAKNVLSLFDTSA